MALEKTVIMEETIAMVLARKFPREKKSPLFYVGGVQQNAFFPLVHYRGCGLIGPLNTSGGVGPRRYGLRIPTGVDFKIWAGQKKILTSVETFVGWMANYIPPWITYLSFMSRRIIYL